MADLRLPDSPLGHLRTWSDRAVLHVQLFGDMPSGRQAELLCAHAGYGVATVGIGTGRVHVGITPDAQVTRDGRQIGWLLGVDALEVTR